MKNIKILSMAALLLASLAAAQAQTTTIAGWDFDAGGAQAAGYNTPSATTGSGLAQALGLSNSYNNTNSITECDVLATAGASTGSGSYGWRLRGAGAAPNGGNGWSSQAPIGTQGAEFSASTVGFNDNIVVSFDVNTTAQAERNLALLYTLDGSTWLDATISSVGTLGTIANNSSSANTVTGSYVKLGSGWNNLITATIAGAQNDANFAVEIVNASTGADCVNLAGSALNNTSGNWRLDNVNITDVVPAPEPSTLALVGLGLTCFIGLRRHKTPQV